MRLAAKRCRTFSSNSAYTRALLRPCDTHAYIKKSVGQTFGTFGNHLTTDDRECHSRGVSLHRTRSRPSPTSRGRAALLPTTARPPHVATRRPTLRLPEWRQEEHPGRAWFLTGQGLPVRYAGTAAILGTVCFLCPNFPPWADVWRRAATVVEMARMVPAFARYARGPPCWPTFRRFPISPTPSRGLQ